MHLHSIIVYFPLVLGFAGAICVWLTSRWPQFELVAKLMWLLGALFSIAAYFTGAFQPHSFDHAMSARALQVHERLGISMGLSLIAGFALLMWPGMKKFDRLWAVFVLIMVSITAYYGAMMA